MRWSVNLTSYCIGLHLKYVCSHSWYSHVPSISRLSWNYWSCTDELTPHALIALYPAIYIYEARMFMLKLLVQHVRANTTLPHRSILRYIQSTCTIRGFRCVYIIDTHAYEPSPSRSSWFSRVFQVGPSRRPDNGHYPLSNGVWNPFHTWALPKITKHHR